MKPKSAFARIYDGMMKGGVRTAALVLDIALGYWLGSSRFGADWRGMNVGGQESQEEWNNRPLHFRMESWWKCLEKIRSELFRLVLLKVSRLIIFPNQHINTSVSNGWTGFLVEISANQLKPKPKLTCSHDGYHLEIPINLVRNVWIAGNVNGSSRVGCCSTVERN